MDDDNHMSVVTHLCSSHHPCWSSAGL